MRTSERCDRVDVQETQGEDHGQRDLLPRVHLQAPEHRQREQEHDDVEDEIQDAVHLEEEVLVHAAPRLVFIPEPADGLAAKDGGERARGEVANDQSQDDPDGAAKGAAGEDAAVEEEDGRAGAGAGGEVEDLGGEEGLWE